MKTFSKRHEPAASPQTHRTFFSRLPIAAYIVAALAALFHMGLFWRAQTQAPEGWEFTGNLSVSPDFMQYRTWLRLTQDEGPFVSNNLTSEATDPYFPAPFYWVIGKLSTLTGGSPEYVLRYTGAALAFGFTLLLFLVVRYFTSTLYRAWWILGIIMLGGGLTTLIKLAGRVEPARGFIAPYWQAANQSLTMESIRFSYVFKVLMDTHYLFIYILTILALVGLHRAITRYSRRNLAVAAILFALITLVHAHEGLLLLLITPAVLGLALAKKLVTPRRAAVLFVVCVGTAGLALVFLRILYHLNGTALSSWAAPDMLFANLALGYALGWILVAWGLHRYWRRAGLDEVFLLGWLAGCLIMALSSPYYPYADRGTTTLQIPLYLIAGAIFFDFRPRVTWPYALIAVLLVGSTPINVMINRWNATDFSEDKPFMFTNASHRATIDLLKNSATQDDVLLADYFDYRWLTPEYPGKSYHAHFFMTVQFPRKEREVEAFFAATPDEQAEFLQREGIRFLFVSPENDPAESARIPGLESLLATEEGTLFRFAGSAQVRGSTGGSVGSSAVQSYAKPEKSPP